MVTAAMFTAFYYGLIEKSGWTSIWAKVLIALISAWFASVGLIVDVVLVPLALLGWLFERFSRRRP